MITTKSGTEPAKTSTETQRFLPDEDLRNAPDDRLTASSISGSSNVSDIIENAKNWQHRPETPESNILVSGEREFYRLCDQLLENLNEINDKCFDEDGRLIDEHYGIVAEILETLERLYDCPFGDGESLKSIVVSIQSQLNNAIWYRKHVDFLRSAVDELRRVYLIDESVADRIDGMIVEFGLDLFRGILSADETRRQFEIREVASK